MNDRDTNLPSKYLSLYEIDPDDGEIDLLGHMLVLKGDATGNKIFKKHKIKIPRVLKTIITDAASDGLLDDFSDMFHEVFSIGVNHGKELAKKRRKKKTTPK